MFKYWPPTLHRDPIGAVSTIPSQHYLSSQVQVSSMLELSNEGGRYCVYLTVEPVRTRAVLLFCGVTKVAKCWREYTTDCKYSYFCSEYRYAFLSYANSVSLSCWRCPLTRHHLDNWRVCPGIYHTHPQE